MRDTIIIMRDRSILIMCDWKWSFQKSPRSSSSCKGKSWWFRWLHCRRSCQTNNGFGRRLDQCHHWWLRWRLEYRYYCHGLCVCLHLTHKPRTNNITIINVQFLILNSRCHNIFMLIRAWHNAVNLRSATVCFSHKITFLSASVTDATYLHTHQSMYAWIDVAVWKFIINVGSPRGQQVWGHQCWRPCHLINPY